MWNSTPCVNVFQLLANDILSFFFFKFARRKVCRKRQLNLGKPRLLFYFQYENIIVLLLLFFAAIPANIFVWHFQESIKTTLKGNLIKKNILCCNTEISHDILCTGVKPFKCDIDYRIHNFTSGWPRTGTNSS